MISELLGTFADNGLSPECIDGALHLLAPCGVSIPSSYTTFVTPIASPKLHTAILARLSSHPDIAETPSWAWLKSFDYLSRCAPPGDSSREVDALLPAERKGTMTPPDILPVWSFSHGPLRETREAATSNSHNARHAQMHFSIQRRGVCHGLAGYFECVLYPGFELSTNPNSMDDKSPNMTSWFSMFFPLQVRNLSF